MIRTIAGLLLVTLIAFAADPLPAQQTAPDSSMIPAAVRAAIDSVNAAWLPDLMRGNAVALAAPYADDGVLVSPDGTTTRGRAAVEEVMRAASARLAGKTLRGRLVQDGLTRVGNLIYEWGHAEVEVDAPPAPSRHLGGHYFTVWREEADGRWRIFRNLSLP